MHTYTHAYIHIYIHTHIHIHTHIQTYIHTYICIHTYNTYMHAYTNHLIFEQAAPLRVALKVADLNTPMVVDYDYAKSRIIHLIFEKEEEQSLKLIRGRAVRRPRRAAAADNLWAPPPTFVDRRAAAPYNLS